MVGCDVLTQDDHFLTQSACCLIRKLLSLWATWPVPSHLLIIVITGRDLQVFNHKQNETVEHLLPILDGII